MSDLTPKPNKKPRYQGSSFEPIFRKNGILAHLNNTPNLGKGASKEYIIQNLLLNADHNRTLDIPNVQSQAHILQSEKKPEVTLNLLETDLKAMPKGMGALHETDLFKIAVRNLTDQDIANNFSHVLNSHTGDDQQKSVRVSILLIFYKVWCGYTKYLFSQVATKGKLVQCPIFGTFLPASAYLRAQNVVPEDGHGTVGQGSITRENLNKLENASVCYAPNV